MLTASESRPQSFGAYKSQAPSCIKSILSFLMNQEAFPVSASLFQVVTIFMISSRSLQAFTLLSPSFESVDSRAARA